MDPLNPIPPEQLYEPAKWQYAINKTNSATSRGICGWSADEMKSLPMTCVESLIEAFQAMEPTGLPCYLMRTKVIALAKKAFTTDPAATRPITILSLAYRIWAKVAANVVLDSWASILPRSITGFLPHRSAMAYQYRFQFDLEHDEDLGRQTTWGGMTLDIQKAFNCIPRLPCRRILHKLGVPAGIINLWFTSLANLSRTWQIDQCYVEFGTMTTGIPEGDPLSVACMVGINAVLNDLLQHPSVWPHFFADNWSYRASDASVHAEIIEAFSTFADSLRLTIDWHKTWCWSTSQEHRQAFVDAASQHVPETGIPVALAAKDLGITLHYRCKQFRQPQAERHDETLTRLQKLQKQDLNLETKAVIIHTACLPKALYATCFYAAGEKWYDQLRTHIGRALVGQHHNVNPYIASSILSKKLLDPMVFTIKHALRAAREFLTYETAEVRQQFLRSVACSNKQPVQIMGPAAALQYYLSKLGWTTTAAGDLCTTSTGSLNLLETPLTVLDLAVDQAWMEHVSVQISHRKGMKHTPVIDRYLTIQTLLQQPKAAQKALALQMVGGYMTNNQKTHLLGWKR